MEGKGVDIDKEVVYQEPVSDAAHLSCSVTDGWSVQTNGSSTHVKVYETHKNGLLVRLNGKKLIRMQ